MLINILLYLWQLPQNLLGLLYKDVLTLRNKCQIINTSKDFEVYTKTTSGSVTLGKYIFVSPKFTSDIIKHEIGHTKQSKLLGPLYLIIIGLPSIFWAGLRRVSPRLKKKYNYYSFYTEKWANNLIK